MYTYKTVHYMFITMQALYMTAKAPDIMAPYMYRSADNMVWMAKSMYMTDKALYIAALYCYNVALNPAVVSMYIAVGFLFMRKAGVKDRFISHLNLSFPSTFR